MNDPVLKINLLVRSEMALVRIQTRRAVSRIILSLVALVFVLLGIKRNTIKKRRLHYQRHAA